ncbi:MAG: FG-GAP-like repeat-containing protein [Planctomycetota bacterium]
MVRRRSASSLAGAHRGVALGIVLVVAPLVTGCGAGLVTGVVAGTGGRGSGPTSPPTLAVSAATAPLVPAPSTSLRRVLFLTNQQVRPGADVRVELRALGQVVDQPQVSVTTTANGAEISFVEEHDAILAQIPAVRRTVADVMATLALYVDGELVGDVLPFQLIRQRGASLAAFGATTTEVSVLGTETFRVRVDGRGAGDLLAGAEVVVDVPGVGPRTASGLMVTPVPDSEDFYVTGTPPRNEFPTRISLSVRDTMAGESTLVTSLFYQPEVQAVSPRYGSTDGGTRVLLVGGGLAPLQNPPDESSIDFDRVEIVFRKGGRDVSVASSALLLTGAQTGIQGSSLSQLEFTTPKSPDGRPGPADVEVVVELDGEVKVRHTRRNAFVYQRLSAGFGPRGALLTEAPVNSAMVGLEGGPDAAADALVLSERSGAAFVELLRAEGNGMLSSFGVPILGASPSNPTQRTPSALRVGDFDGDSVLDAIVVNRGTRPAPGSPLTGPFAEHTFLRGLAAPLPPLQLSSVVLQDDAFHAFAASSGDFDSDGVPDLVTLYDPATNPRLPQLFLSRPPGGFVATDAFINEPLTGFEILDVTDQDGDGAQDAVFVQAKLDTDVQVGVAWGGGDGTITAAATFAASDIPDYDADIDLPAVAVHALGRPGAAKSLAIVLQGSVTKSESPPTVVVLRPSAELRSRQPFQQARGIDTVNFNDALAPIVASAAGDLDGDGTTEIVVGLGDAATSNLVVLRWHPGDKLERLPIGTVVSPLEPMRGIKKIEIANAVAADGGRFPEPVRAVYVQHELETATGTEHWISTWLVLPGSQPGQELSLIPPDASLPFIAGQVVGTALGNFSGAGGPVAPGGKRAARDLMLLTNTVLAQLNNDGVGGFRLGFAVPLPGGLDGSLTTLPQTDGSDAVVFLLQDGRIGVHYPGEEQPRINPQDLRSLAESTRQNWELMSDSRLVVGDVDGDGIDDLVVSLVLLNPDDPEDRDTTLIPLRGRAAGGPLGFPFSLPAQGATTGFEASDIVIGNFVADPTAANDPRELAVAFPLAQQAGGRVQFYRYDPDTDKLALSHASQAAQWLIAGVEPRALAAVDFNDTGKVDLAVASADGQLRVFINNEDRNPAAPSEVNVGSFTQTQLGSALPAGTPTRLMLGDLNGDDTPDLIATSRQLVPVGMPSMPDEQDHQVAVYLNDGTGELRLARILPSVRTGNRLAVPGTSTRPLSVAPMIPALGDLNLDGVPDLVIGWGRDIPGDNNVRLLFGAAR